jgi:hypothetical protein
MWGSDEIISIVNDRGYINLKQKRIFVGNLFAGFHAGVREFVEKAAEVWFGDFLLGTINPESGLIEPGCDRIQANNNT